MTLGVGPDQKEIAVLESWDLPERVQLRGRETTGKTSGRRGTANQHEANLSG